MSGRPDENLLGNNGNSIQHSSTVKGLAGLVGSYLNSDFHTEDSTFDANKENSAQKQFFDDDHQNDILCIDDQDDYENKLIDDDATRTSANWESCHVGETIIPALKEETTVQQAACFSSDSGSSYVLKGCANNNYKICGSMTQAESTCQQGAKKDVETMSLSGNKSKQYCQSGNKAFSGCCEDQENQLCEFGLKSQLLDDEAGEVTTDPSERVKSEVEQAVRASISKMISQAVQFAFDEALESTIRLWTIQNDYYQWIVNNKQSIDLIILTNILT